jgi:uncharacterized membrane protein YdbT with pleckstrin-like domain
VEPIYLFTIAGALSMAGALSARQVMQDALSGAEHLDQSQQSQVAKRYLLAGNLAVIGLVVAMIYGWQSFVWWIPAAFLIVTFPALYYVFLNRLLTAKGGALIYTAGAWVALVPYITAWFD